MLNRDQRRKYAKKIAKRKEASICPKCGYKAIFYSTARGENDTVVKCEICDEIVFEGPDVTRVVPPGIEIPLPLEIFEVALKAPPEEEKKEDEIIEGEFTENIINEEKN